MSPEFLQNLEESLKNEARTIEEVYENLEKTTKKKVKQTIENCVYVLKHDPLLKDAICRNNLTVKTDIVKEMPWTRRGPAITDADDSNIRFYLEKNYELTSERAISAAIKIIANENSFHPIIDKLNTFKWDGKPRISTALHHFLGAEANAYTAEVMKLHMLAALHRIYNPGCKYDICLCLVGDQGGGKSTFFRFLAIQDEWFSDDLRRFDDDNVFQKIQGHWIIELSEMTASAKTKSIEEIKSFLTRQKETYKIPYERHPEDRLRQCVFCGTTNDMQFLPFDRSGNRRFAPVLINPAKAVVHPMDNEEASRAYINQMWAEAMVIYHSLEEVKLDFSESMEEYAHQLQRDFMPEDTELGVIEAYLEENHILRTCVKEIYCEAYGHAVKDEIPVWASKKITSSLRKLGYEDKGSRKFAMYGSQKLWEKKEEPPADADEDGFVQLKLGEKVPFV